MQKFFKHVFVIVLVIIGLMFLSDYIYSYILINGTPRSKIQYSLQRSDEHFDYIFLGSSRTENHIQCELIEEVTGKSCVNFGISGGLIGDMLILMKVLSNQNISYDRVFIQVDHTYNYTGVSEDTKARLMPYNYDLVVRKELKKDVNNIYYNNIPFYRYMKFDRVVGFREVIVSLIGKKSNMDYSDGFKANIGSGLDHTGNLPETLAVANYELKELKNLVKENGGTLDYFTAPFCSITKNRELGEKLKKRIPTLRSYISIYDDREEYFYDCAHLNIEGATDFTKRIIEDYDLNSD